jgi:von Willebrand factor type A domain/von Willebrand factor type A C-terminal domain
MTNTFTGTVHQNKYLAAGAVDVDAIVSIGSTLAPAAPGGPARAAGGLVVGFVGDGSGSMSGEKWRHTRQALIDAVRALPDTCELFVIIGRTAPEVLVPLQAASTASKARAIEALGAASASGGTRFSAWLAAARSEFARGAGGIRVLVFLTDGENDEGGDQPLIDELARCAGLFEVESRGVGDQYRPDQLRLIQQALHGSVDIIRRPEDLSHDFAQIVARAASLTLGDVYLQLWTPVGARVEMVKQFGAEILDLTGKMQPGPSPRLVRVPTGSWGEEARDFHVVVKLDPAAVGKVGDTKLCARASLVYRDGGREIEAKLDAGGQILAVWTDDEKQSAVIHPKVANYTGQAELAQRIQEGVKALEAGNVDVATAALQRASALAAQTGHEATQRLIRKLADVDDKGTLRIKKEIDTMDVKELDTRSQRTARTRRVAAEP